MKLHTYDVVQQPVITEKLTRFQESENKYAFKVHPDSNKKQIKAAIEKYFNVQVEKVHTMNCQGKWRRVRYKAGRTPMWKKAIVTLKEGDKIDLAV